jgi:hypothetical protein
MEFARITHSTSPYSQLLHSKTVTAETRTHGEVSIAIAEERVFVEGAITI